MAQARAKIDWPRIRDEFVQGVFEGGRHHYPTQGELAQKFGVNLKAVQKQSTLDSQRGIGSWLDQRQKMEALARARHDTLQADRIAEIRSNFDNHCLVTANAALQKLVRLLSVWEGVDPATQKLRKGAASEIQALANAFTSIQKAGRLAAGYATDNVSYRGELSVTLTEAFEQWLAKVDVKQLSSDELRALETLTQNVAAQAPERAVH
jgi:hypothetical protein